MPSPVLTNLAASLTFLENAVNITPVLFDSDATLTDAENNFTGGRLVLSGLLAEDRVSIATGGVFSLNGATLIWDDAGTAREIGTVSGGVGNPFNIIFNGTDGSLVTASVVEALIENLTYANVSDAPTASRTLTLAVHDNAPATFTQLTGSNSADPSTYNPFTGLNAGSYSAPAFVDLDADGDLDLVSGNGAGMFKVWGNESGVFVERDESTHSGSFPFSPNTPFSAPTFVDLNADGQLDLVAGNQSGTFNVWLKNNGPGYTQLTGTNSADALTYNPFTGITVSGSSKPVFADVVGDSDLELISGSGTGFRVWQKNDSSAGYTEVTGTNNPFNGLTATGGGPAPSLADLDGDGDLDLLSGNLNGTIQVWLKGPSGYAAATGSNNPFTGVDVGSFSVLTSADIDGDGDADLVAGAFLFAGGVLGLFSTFRNNSAVQKISVNVTAENDTPVLAAPILDQSIAEDGTFNYTVPEGAFTDPDNAALIYTATLANGDSLPGTLALDSATRTFSGSPPANFNGVLAIKITASDGVLSVSDEFTLIVTPVNDAPVVAVPIDDQSIAEEGTFSFTVPDGTFTDPENTELTYSATLADGSALPGTLAFDAATRTFSGSPPANFNGDLAIRVTASDGELSVSEDFTLTVTPVNDAPVLAAPIDDQSIAEDGTFSFIVPAGTFTDLDNTALTYSATLADGSALPGTLAINATTGAFTGKPPANFNGVLAIKVTASDGALSVSDEFNLTVTPVNDAPVLSTLIANQSIAEDASFTFRVPAGSFTDVDNATLRYTATLASGAALPGTLAINATTGTFSGSPAANFNGVLAIKVTASDGTLSVSDEFNLTVTPVNDAPVLRTSIADRTIAEDGTLSFTVPANTFTDVDNATLRYSAKLANGAALPGTLAINALTGTFSGKPPSNFNGVLDIRVTATDAGGLTANDIFRLSVTTVNDAPVVVTPIANRSIAQDSAPFSFSVASAFQDPDRGVLTYTAKQFSGDALPVWLKFSNGAFIATPPIEASPVNITVTARDSGGATVSDTFLLSFSAPNIALMRGASDASNTLTGSSGNDKGRLGAGNDVYDGGAGDDTVLGGTGNDRILGNIGNDALYGEAGSDTIDGGAGNDLISGGLGADILTGGIGSDSFLFNTRDGSFDRIEDFSVAADTIRLDSFVFTGLAKDGALAATAFRLVALSSDALIASATDATDRLIYNKTTGSLFYDANGAGGIAATKIAVLDPGLTLTAADFIVV